ncbi:hypothetical protein D3C85_1414950 [compost metagenome]
MPAIRARPVCSLDERWRNPGLRRGCWRDVGLRGGLELRFSWDERAPLTQPTYCGDLRIADCSRL